MSFKLKANPTFKRTIQIKDLDGNASELKLVMKHMRRSVLKEFSEALTGRSDDDIVADIVVGWEDVDTEFSQDALRELLQEYAGAAALIWIDYQAAYQDAARKN